jgi:small-conductance mechanosensitive channel
MLSSTLFTLGPFNICFWNLFSLTIIFLLAEILKRIVHRLLKKYVKTANINMEGRRVAWLKLISLSVYLLAIYIAFLSLKFNNKSITFGDFLNFKLINLKSFHLDFFNIFVIFSIFFASRILVNFSKIVIGRKFRKAANSDLSTEYVYVKIAKYVIYVFAIIFCLQVLDVNLTLLLTGSAALLVGIGLGLQDVFKDVFAGFVLLFEGNLRVGDIVEITSGSKNSTKSSSGIVAKIVKINVRTSQIETREGNVLIIPNTRLTQEQVENWSHGSELTRFIINLTVEYGANTELIKRLLKQAALAHPKVKKSHPILVRLSNFGDSGLELELVFWADQSWDINNYKSEIRFEIDRLFREYDIKIPYPKRDILMNSDKENLIEK